MSTESTKTARDAGLTSNDVKYPEEEEAWTVHSLSLTREIAFVSVVSACQLFTQSGLGMAIAPLHIIGDDMGIGGEPAYLSWSPAAYSLTVGTFILIAGRIGDLYGHKRAVIWGWVWYGFWSLIGGESVPPHSRLDS
jgi:MFS family permease